MSTTTLDLGSYNRERGRRVAPAMLAIIREQGPIDHLTALAELKRTGRVKRGVTYSDAGNACRWLVAEGLIEQAPGSGKFRPR